MSIGLEQYLETAKRYYKDTGHLAVLWGDDFRYVNAYSNYYSLDNMIECMNKYHGDKYFFKYSTPSIYLDAIKKKNIKWPTMYNDMFPYSDRADAYWTGYFTSRPNDKQ